MAASTILTDAIIHEKKYWKKRNKTWKSVEKKKSNTSQGKKNPSNRIVKILTIFPPPFLIDQNSNIDFNYSETRQNEMNKKKTILLERILY